MMKKLASILLAILMVALLSSAAMAEENVAKIGGNEYATLQAAFNAAKDGDIINVIRDVTITQETGTANGKWMEGVLYEGDASFTVDLGDHTITNGDMGNDGDYLIYLRNKGDKTNTITFKNGTIHATSGVYSAIAAGSGTLGESKKTTINLENINIYGNHINGAVLKIRGGCELNMKSGTEVISNNGYTVLESIATGTVTNIYSGATMTQQNTAPNNSMGSALGASENGTINVYGGTMTSDRWGAYVYNSGGTINIYDGSITATRDALRPEAEKGAQSIINVYGGTINGTLQESLQDNISTAHINVIAGTFSEDPTAYVHENSEVKGSYIVSKKPVVATVGNAEYYDLQTAIDAADGQVVKVQKDVQTDVIYVANKVTLDLNGYEISPAKNFSLPTGGVIVVRRGGDLTIEDSGSNGIIKAQGNGQNVYCAVLMTLGNDPIKDVNTTATLTVNGGTLMGSNFGISGNGNPGRQNTVVKIQGGHVTVNKDVSGGKGLGIYQPQEGQLTITNGKVSGDTGIEVRSGTLTVNGGTISSWSDKLTNNYSGNGASVYGAALAISQHTTTKSINVVINNGTLEGSACALYQGLHNGESASRDVTISVKGMATFDGPVSVQESGVMSVEDGLYKKAFDTEKITIPQGKELRLDEKIGYYRLRVIDEFMAEIVTTPANATVELKAADGTSLEMDDGVFTVKKGVAYTYTVSYDGYVTKTGKFTVSNGDVNIEVTLEAVVNAKEPKITQQPVSAVYENGEQLKELSVVAESPDGGKLSYQWYEATSNNDSVGTQIAGATKNTYTPVMGAGTKYFFCVVTNTNENVTGEKTASWPSAVAAITVKPGPDEHTADILIYGNKKGLEYTKVSAYMMMLGSSDQKYLHEDMQPTYGEGSVQYEYKQVAEDGQYNLIITATEKVSKKEVTMTTLVDLRGQNDTHTVTLPDVLKSSVVDGTEETGIIVGGVEAVAAAQEVTVPGGHLEVQLQIEEEKQVDKEDKDAIAEKAAEGGATVEQIVNIDLILKQFNAANTQVSEQNLGDENDQLLKILIPFQLGDRKPENVVMLRMHDDEVQTLRQIPATSNKVTDECFIVYNDHIELHAKKFSAYAIAYNKGDAAVISDPTEAKTVSVLVGDTATMTVTAQNAKRYQWQINRNDGEGWIDCGENKPVYITSATTLDNNGYQYKCIVTGTNDKAVESPIFTLEVISSVSLPTTGDNSNMALWLAMLGMSMLVLCGAALKRRVN